MLNFKDWKLASSDGKKATLKHANGHEMTIAMGALPKIQREQIKRLAKVQNFDDGGDVSTAQPAPDSTDSASTSSPDHSTTININAAPTPTAPIVQPPSVTPPAQNPAAVYGNQQVAPNVPDIPNGLKNLNPTGTMNPEAVAKNTQEAVQGQQAIDASKAQASVPNEQGYIRGIGDTQQNAQALYNQMQGHVNDFNSYVQQHPINPNAYLENQSAGKRVLSGLGLILGGIGAGKLGSTDNPALRALNAQIDRDIAAQQGRVNNQRTVLGAYQDLYGQGVAANNLTKASLLDIYNHKAQLLADQLGTPQAKVAAQQLGANLAIEKSKLLQDSAVNLSVLPGSHPTSSDMGAANIPHTQQGPGSSGNQGPTSAQAAPGSNSGQLVDANGKPVDMKAAALAGIPVAGSDQDLEAKGIYRAGNTPSDQRKAVTATPISPILHQGAEDLYKGLQYTPKARDQFGEITKQYTAAQQADKQLGQINQVYGNLIQGSQEGGVFGRAHRLGAHALGGLGTVAGGILGSVVPGLGTAAGATGGAALGEGLGAATNTDVNRLYDSNKTALLGAISSALKGTNVGDSSIHEVVEKNAPEYGDSSKTLKQKHDNIEHFIKSHVETSLLKTWHLSDE